MHSHGLAPSATISMRSELRLMSLWSLWASRDQCMSLDFTTATRAAQTTSKKTRTQVDNGTIQSTPLSPSLTANHTSQSLTANGSTVWFSFQQVTQQSSDLKGVEFIQLCGTLALDLHWANATELKINESNKLQLSLLHPCQRSSENQKCNEGQALEIKLKQVYSHLKHQECNMYVHAIFNKALTFQNESQ